MDHANELEALEALMNEFYHPDCTNTRKQEIECVLYNFRELSKAWKISIYFITHTNNQYVIMYCLSVLETVITRKWVGLTGADRTEIRDTLYTMVLMSHQSAPKYFLNKLVKLLVDIARIDWPHLYPDFFPNILRLIQAPETSVLGLLFLQTASEELVCPWEDLSVARKDDLKHYFLHYVPEVFRTVSHILQTFIQANGFEIRTSSSILPASSSSTNHPYTNPNSNSDSLFRDNFHQRRNNSDLENAVVCSAALQAISHIFSWVPVDVIVEVPILVKHLFSVANIIPDCNSIQNESVGILAISALTEIMYKIFMPATCRNVLMEIAMHMTLLLQRLVNASDLEKVNPIYLDKTTEFLLHFVKNYLHRLETNTDFSAIEFLFLLFSFTFRQRSLERYARCLDIWLIFINSVHGFLPEIRSRYSGSLLAIASEVLKQSQFNKWEGLLDLLDDKNQDVDGITELESFMMKNMEVLTEIAHFMPLDLFNVMFHRWDEICKTYLCLHEKIETVNEYPQLLLEEEENVQLHYVLKDMSYLVRLIGCMELNFNGHSFEDEFKKAENIAKYVKDMSTYAVLHRFHHVKVSDPKLTADFIEVHVQVLEALRPWCNWILHLGEDSRFINQYSANVDGILNATVPILVSKNESPKLHLAAARLLLHFVRVVRPPTLWLRAAARAFFEDISQILELPDEAQRLALDAVYCSLLLPWPTVGNNLWEMRETMFGHVIELLTWKFNKEVFSPGTPLPAEKQTIVMTLRKLEFLVHDMKNEGMQTKSIICEAIKEHIQKSFNLFLLYEHVPDLCEAILDFFVTIFGSLLHMIGPAMIGRIVQDMLMTFNRKQLMARLVRNIEKGDESECRAVEKYLTLLQLISAEPGQAFNCFINSTISFCLDHVFPVAEPPTAGIKLGLFMVFHSILLNKWQYFYPSLLKQGTDNERVNNQQQFVGILQAYGQTLLEPDINIFKHNLTSLEELNARRNLYQKKLFVQMLWGYTLSALLTCLINKTHSLLDEDIYLAVYNMASVNFFSFHNRVLKQFLLLTEGLDNGQRNILRQNCRLEKDAPSFTQNLQRLVNDLRCYRICNNCLLDMSTSSSSDGPSHQ